MGIIDRELIQAEDDGELSALDRELVYQIAVRQRFVADKYDVDGTTVLDMRTQVDEAVDALEPQQRQLVRAYLTYLDDTGIDTFRKSGGTDGINFDPTRDAAAAEVAICQLLFDRPDPVSGGGPYFA